MSKSAGSREIPAWLMPAAVVVGLIVIVFLAVRALTGPSVETPGPPRKVYPGMYDFKKEASEGNIGRRVGGEGAPPP
jgi:hypothetical protein